MDNQDQYIKMVFQNAVEQIRAFGAALEEIQMALAAKKPYKTKIACVGSILDFESFAKNLGHSIPSVTHPDEREFFHNGVFYINVYSARPKGYYPKCDAIVFLGGYLSPGYLQVIDDLEGQQQIYLIDPIQLFNLVK